MKKILFNVAIFCKRPGIISRLVILGASLILTFTVFFPDLIFNIEMENPKSFTIEELQSTPKEKLPRYIVVKDAQVMQAAMPFDLGIDSLKDFDMKFYTYNYVMQQKVKKGDTSLSYILYPVYSKTYLEKNPKSEAKDVTSYVIMKDSHVKKKDLEGNKYFKDSTFSVNGKYDGDKIDQESHKLLTESGYNVSKEAIVLEKGSTPMSLVASILGTTVALLIGAIVILSLLPLSILQNLFNVAEL